MKIGIPTLVACFVAGGMAGAFAFNFFVNSNADVDPELADPADSVPADLASDSTVQTLQSVAVASRKLSYGELLDAAFEHDSYRKKQYELELVFDSMAAADAPGVLLDILAIADPRKRGDAMRPFFVKWGELDGEAAHARAKELKGRDRNDGLSAVLAGWAHTDVHASWEVAIEMVENGGSGPFRLARGALTEMAKQDPDFMIEYIASGAAGDQVQSVAGCLVEGAMQEGRPDELLAKLHLIEDLEVRRKLTEQTYQRWGMLDTEAPLAAMAGISDPDEAKTALSGFLKGWVESDVEGALSYAFDNLDVPAVKDSFSHMLGQTFIYGSEEDNFAVVARLDEAGLIDQYGPLVANRLSFMQPDVAIRLAEGMSDEKERLNVTSRAISSLARRDLSKALAHYEAAETSTERLRYFSSLGWTIARRSDGGEVLESLIQKLPEGADRTKAVESILGIATRPNVQASEQFRQSLKEILASQGELSQNAKHLSEKLFPPES